MRGQNVLLPLPQGRYQVLLQKKIHQGRFEVVFQKNPSGKISGPFPKKSLKEDLRLFCKKVPQGRSGVVLKKIPQGRFEIVFQKKIPQERFEVVFQKIPQGIFHVVSWKIFPTKNLWEWVFEEILQNILLMKKRAFQYFIHWAFEDGPTRHLKIWEKFWHFKNSHVSQELKKSTNLVFFFICILSTHVSCYQKIHSGPTNGCIRDKMAFYLVHEVRRCNNYDSPSSKPCSYFDVLEKIYFVKSRWQEIKRSWFFVNFLPFTDSLSTSPRFFSLRIQRLQWMDKKK